MRTCYITFRSVTYAQRGEAVLRAAGVPGALQRARAWMRERGCGYCLRLREDQLPRAVEALDRAQVRYGRVWLQAPSGDAEEWRP